MKSQWTIGKKLMAGFAGMLVVALVMGVTSLNSITRLSASLDKMVNQTTRKIVLADAINTAGSDMLAAQRGIIAYAYAKSPAGIENAYRLAQTAGAAWESGLQEIRPLLTVEEAKQITARLSDQLIAWRSAMSEMKQLADSGNAEGAFKVATEKGVPIYEANTRDASRLTAVEQENLQAERAAAASLKSTAMWLAVVMLALAIGLGGIVVFVVRQTNRVLQRSAAELGETAEQVASAAGQVSASSQALAQGASEQAASLEETSASSEEITSMTRKNTDNSKMAAEHMVEASAIVSEANKTLEGMVASMREINASSDKIGKIIKVIDEIAFQTNILALNAAVEAARAGEAGMGFAVVADEVRNLAQRSAQAAKDTAALIEESIAKSNEGSTRLEQVATAIRAITQSSQKVKTLVDEVNLGSEEQARGIEQIAKAITQMEQVTQKTAANAEESASAGEEMSAQANALNAIVQRLRALVGGSELGRLPARQHARERSHPVRRAPALEGGSAAELHALHHAVARREPELHPAPVSHDRSAIPIEEDFKEF